MISVIIATKNGEKYIARAVHNALEQSVAISNAKDPSQFSGFEIVVVSDGSTDNTANIVRELASEDARVRLIELTQNIGPGLARNLAILGGKIENESELIIPPIANPFVAILDDDDLWQNPKKIENQISYFNENPNVVVAGAVRTEFTRENGEHLRWIINETDPQKIRANMLSYNPIITSSVVFRTNIFKEIGGFKPMYLAEDYDLWLRMGLHGDTSNVEGAETIYTIREGGASKSRQLEMAQVVIRLAKEYRHQYPHFYKAYVKGILRLVLVYWKLLKKKFK
jgi:glycosyltransferase involved in cell wall biosynthesis